MPTPRRAATPLTTSRWSRYGHDRVYVYAPDGSALGFLDLRTREVVVFDRTRETAVLDALAPYDHGAR